MKNKQYVRWFYPGAFFSNTEDEEMVDGKMPEMPDRAYAYQTYSRLQGIFDGEFVEGKAKDFSCVTYHGEVLTLEQVKRIPGTDTLQGNMQCNGWNKVVRTKYGQMFHLNPEDRVIKP